MTKTEICNIALARIGVSRFVANIETDTTNEANVLRLFYDICLRRVLEAGLWNFATKTVQLADIGTPINGWGYRYRYPSDCVTARMVNDDLSDLTISLEDIVYGDIRQKFPFEVIGDSASSSLAICCNVSPAFLVYTALETNTAIYPMFFVDALSWNIATEIASPLSAAPGMAAAAGNAYLAAFSRANVRNANESQPFEYVSEYDQIRG